MDKTTRLSPPRSPPRVTTRPAGAIDTAERGRQAKRLAKLVNLNLNEAEFIDTTTCTFTQKITCMSKRGPNTKDQEVVVVQLHELASRLPLELRKASKALIANYSVAMG